MLDHDRRHLLAYIATAAVLVGIAARYVGGDGGSHPVPQISMAAPASAKPAGERPRIARPAQQLIWVDVAGAVARPGLYSLPKGARVAAAITRAGGVGRRANRAAVNLAAKLADGQQIFVPAAGSAGPSGSAASAVPSGVSAGSIAGGSVGTTAGGSPGGASAAGAPISLSNASQQELEQLDGIGPALAQRIIQYREQHGGFHSIDELQEVSGIGDKRFQALKDSIAP